MSTKYRGQKHEMKNTEKVHLIELPRPFSIHRVVFDYLHRRNAIEVRNTPALLSCKSVTQISEDLGSCTILSCEGCVCPLTRYFLLDSGMGGRHTGCRTVTWIHFTRTDGQAVRFELDDTGRLKQFHPFRAAKYSPPIPVHPPFREAGLPIPPILWQKIGRSGSKALR
jgi:hypothetical protein